MGKKNQSRKIFPKHLFVLFMSATLLFSLSNVASASNIEEPTGSSTEITTQVSEAVFSGEVLAADEILLEEEPLGKEESISEEENIKKEEATSEEEPQISEEELPTIKEVLPEEEFDPPIIEVPDSEIFPQMNSQATKGPTIKKVEGSYADRFVVFVHGENLSDITVARVDGVSVPFTILPSLSSDEDDYYIKINLDTEKYKGDETVSVRVANLFGISNTVDYDISYNQIYFSILLKEGPSYYCAYYDTGINPATGSTSTIVSVVVTRIDSSFPDTHSINTSIKRKNYSTFYWSPKNGTYELVLVDEYGRISMPYTITIDNPVAELESITPSYTSFEHASEKLITIKGKNFFIDNKEPIIKVGDITIESSSIVSVSNNEISFYPPSFPGEDQVYKTVTVTNISEIPSNELSLLYGKWVPVIESINPAEVDLSGGTIVEVNGRNFLNPDEEMKLFLGGTEIDCTVKDDETILFEMPDYSQYIFTEVDLKIEDSRGSSTISIPLVRTASPPILESLSPSIVPYDYDPNPKVVLKGTGLSRVIMIYFGGQNLPNFQIISDSEIWFWPGQAAGLEVGISAGYYDGGIFPKVTNTLPLVFENAPQPLIERLEPAVSVEDEWIKIYGKHFDSNCYVVVQGVQTDWVQYRLIDENTMEFKLPGPGDEGYVAPGTYKVTVCTVFAYASNEVDLERASGYPVILTMSTDTVDMYGELVTFTGLNLDDIKVMVDGIEAEITTDVLPAGTSELTFRSPFIPATGKHQVYLERKSDGYKSGSFILNYTAGSPVLSALEPSSISINGNMSVVIYGDYFVDVESVKVGGVSIEEYIVEESTHELVFSPPPAPFGTEAEVVVVTAEGASNPLTLRYDRTLPEITGGSPEALPSIGGRVTLSGNYFIEVQSVLLEIGAEVINVDFTCTDENTIVFDAPPGNSLDKIGIMVVTVAGISNLWTMAYDESLPHVFPRTADFDKYEKDSDYKDIQTTLVLKGHTLEAIALDGVVLTSGEDYLLSNDTLTFSKTYLSRLSLGKQTFLLQMNNNATAEFIITISDSTVPVSGISLRDTIVVLTPQSTANLEVTILPDNASDKTLVWSSTNPSVATVDAKGTITAHRIGNTTITVRSNNGEFTASCEVKVVENQYVFEEPFPLVTDTSQPAVGRTNGPHSEFESLVIDGVTLVRESQYTIAEGSTVITLLPQYLGTLSNGSHAVIANYINGAAFTTLVIDGNSPNPDDPSGTDPVERDPASQTQQVDNKDLNPLSGQAGTRALSPTGDNSDLWFWINLGSLSLLMCSSVLVIQKRKIKLAKSCEE